MKMANLRELLSGGTVRLLTHFLVRPDQRLHLRALQERTGMGTGALQRELRRFEALGLVRRAEEGGKVYFDPVHGHPSWTALRTLLREHGDPVEIVREVLRDVPGIRAAFVFGSTVRGARGGSDVDVLIVEEGMPTAAIGRAMIEAESLLNRPLDVQRFTRRPRGQAAPWQCVPPRRAERTQSMADRIGGCPPRPLTNPIAGYVQPLPPPSAGGGARLCLTLRHGGNRKEAEDPPEFLLFVLVVSSVPLCEMLLLFP